MIEQHRLWGCSLRPGVSLGFGVDSETEALGWILQFANSSTILSRLLGVLWALETCRALLKGVFYFRVEEGEGVLRAPSYKGLQYCKVPPTLYRMTAVSQGYP